MTQLSATPTLKSKINRLTCLVVVVVGIIAITGIFTFARLNQKVRVKNLVASMTQSAKDQTDLLIPTFILPEQREGAKLILKKIEQEDSLELASVLSSETEVPPDFVKCHFEAQSTSCVSLDGKHIATVAAIREGDQTFGYLFKVKNSDTVFGTDQSLYLIEVIAGVLILTFLALLWGMTRITARDVPNSLNKLALWVESVLNDQTHSSQAPDLAFAELNELAKQITKIAEQYAMTRDQAVVGQIASGVMHDINTPLQPMLSAVELIEEKNHDETKRLKYLENLFKVCKSKLPVINNIVQTTLDGVRQIKVSPVPSNINDTIRNAISLSAEIADLKTTQLEFIEDSTQTGVVHDPIQMTRVFTNLIKNSAEAQVKSAVPKIRITVSARNNSPVVLIEDAGPGLEIKPNKIFHAFKSTKIHGSGLGLHVSWKIVQAHGGKLTVGKSIELGGAQFEITLPAPEVVV